MDFRITMLKNAAHPFGVLRSKGKKKKEKKTRKLCVFKLILIFNSYFQPQESHHFACPCQFSSPCAMQ
jgi:hypothetical protein